MSDWKMVMNREDVVNIMTDVVNEMNRQMAWSQGIPSDQVEDVLKKQKGELDRVNGLIYDRLKLRGIIL
jgi:hypothetical protein